MSNKKIVIIAALVSLIVGGGAIGYSVVSDDNAAESFASTGYVLTADSEDKQVLVDSSSKYKKTTLDSVSFRDIQGSKTVVSDESFVHYDNGEVAALSDGVVVDLNDIQTSQMTNYYAVSSSVRIAQEGSSYSIVNGSQELKMDEFLWKLGADKYLICGSDLQVNLATDDVRDAGDFIEVSYIDGDIVQIQTAENVWQTVSPDCYVSLDNGDFVDLHLRGVEDANGSVLMDFSKIVLDSEDNIEVTPISDDLSALQENTIPHFEVFTQDGKDGSAGSDGSDGDEGGEGGSGYQGNQGDPGESGTDGDAGDPGASGSKGNPGSSQQVEGTVLTYPVFNILNWTISSTGCSGTIQVSDNSGTMLSNVDETNKYSAIKIIDVETNSVVETYLPTTHFTEGSSANVTFNFTGLEPDHNYRLVVSAKINTGLGGEDYVRDFISKTFWTDSIGLYMEDGGSTTKSVTVNVLKRDYAGEIDSARLYLFSTYDKAYVMTLNNPQNYLKVESDITTFTASETFSDLSPDTKYYARLIARKNSTDLLLSQILELQTLKEKATIGAPALSANKDSWAFEITPGTIYDPNSGIESFIYEFYAETDVTNGKLSSNAQPVKSVTTDGSGAITVPIDGQSLVSGTGYYVRTTAVFNDNEKTSYIYSDLSNRAQANGAKLPIVYFVETGTASGTSLNAYSTAAELSSYYDKLYGTLVVAPSADSAQVLLTHDNHPEVVIRAAGVYYAKYPVYLEDDPNKPTDTTTYLTGTVSGGYVYINIPAVNLANLRISDTSAVVSNKSAAVYGLKPNTQYQMVVIGDLSSDGTNVFEYETRVGSCVVETPDTVVSKAIWVPSTTLASGQTFAASVQLTASTGTQQTLLTQQFKNVTSVKLNLNFGRIGNTYGDTYTTELTNENYKSVLNIDQNDTSITCLGDALISGFEISNTTFGLSSSDVGNVSSVVLTVDAVSDYTVLAKNRVNQKAYINDDTDALDEPQAVVGQDGAVYINTFSVANNQKEIELQPSPDPVPAIGDGFTTVKQTTDGYSLVANYANSGKLAKSITFYVFDQVDYYGKTVDFTDDTKWQISGDFGGGNYTYVPRDACTLESIADGSTIDLGRITIQVPDSGKIPTVRFIPMTKAQYCAENSIAESDLMTNSSGEYLLFYKEGSTEPATGHQFIFAWTLTYQTSSTAEVLPYPYAVPSNNTPCSKVQDVPRADPVIYAAPYDTTESISIWGLYIEDTEGTILSTASETNLYSQKSRTSAEPLYDKSETSQITVPVHSTFGLSSLDDLFSSDNQISISNGTKNISDGKGSLAASVRVQWYTDKYTNGGNGLFVGDTPQGYVDGTIEYSTSKKVTVADNSSIIPYYYNAFTYYYDKTDFYAIDQSTPAGAIKEIKIEEAAPTGSTNVNHYVVTITPDSPNALDSVNGYRVEFVVNKTGGGQVSAYTDKCIDSETWSRDSDSGAVQFEIYISREIMDVAGVEGTLSINVYAMYESGNSGIIYLQKSDGEHPVSIRSYTLNTHNSYGYEVKPSGWYYASASKAIAESQNTVLPRMGSFFTGRINGTLDTKGTSLSATLSVASTRSTTTASIENTNWKMNLTRTAGCYDGSRIVTFKELLFDKATVSVAYYDQYGKSATPSVPSVTCTIEYVEDEANSNSITSDFEIKGAPGVLKFILKDKDGNILVYNDESLEWEKSDIKESEISKSMSQSDIDKIAATTVDPASSKHFEIYNLIPDTTYVISAYYWTDGHWRILNMPYGNGEINNYLSKTTAEEPNINMDVYYNSSSYSAKYITVYPLISKVANYYYLLELQDAEGDHITYLKNGVAAECSGFNDATSWYEFGREQCFENYNTAFGLTYYSTGFNTSSHEVTVGTTQVNLEYGKTYKVYARIYEIGTGPLYIADYDMSADTANMIHSDYQRSNALRSFTVNNTEDKIILQSKYSLVADSSESSKLVPTITFNARYQGNINLLRGEKLAYIFVRQRPDANGNYTSEDVTKYVSYGVSTNNPDGYDISTIAISKSGNTFTLSNDNKYKDDTLIQEGDIFTCYCYGIYDDEAYGTKTATPVSSDISPTASGTNLITYPNQGNTWWHDTILAGRGVGDSFKYAVTEDSINLTDGSTAVSKLLSSERKIAPAGKTSAGDVTVTFYNNTFTIQLDSPVNETSIKYLNISISTEYRETTDGDLKTSSSVQVLPVSLIQISNTVYQLEVPYSKPDVQNIESIIINGEFVDDNQQLVYITGTGGTTRTEDGKRFGDSFDASLLS